MDLSLDVAQAARWGLVQVRQAVHQRAGVLNRAAFEVEAVAGADVKDDLRSELACDGFLEIFGQADVGMGQHDEREALVVFVGRCVGR